MMTANTAVQVIVQAVVTKSLKKRPGCNDHIFNQVKQRIQNEVEKLVMRGQSQLDIILLEKKRLEAIFCSEKLSYEAANEKRIIDYSDVDDDDDGGGSNDVTKTKEKRINKRVDMKKSVAGSEVSPNKPNTTKKYFEYLAEYKNDNNIYDRVKGIEMRGKNFAVSNTGACPKCSNKSNMFVVLDFLFPPGEMPEILHYLLSLGKAVLWSSKETLFSKNPPTFLCQGKCPTEIGKSGFNINWNKTDLDKIFLFPEENFKELANAKVDLPQELEASAVDKPDSFSDHLSYSEDSNETEEEMSEDEYDEGDVDIDYYKKNVSWVVLDELALNGKDNPEVKEDCIIRNMLALEKAREDFINGEMKRKRFEDNGECNGESEIAGSGADDTNEQAVKDISKVKEKPTNPVVESINLELKNKAEILDHSTSQTDYRLIKKKENSSDPTVPPLMDILIGVKSDLKEAAPHKSPPSATHILKGATYYDPSKEVKDSKPAFTIDDFPVSKDGSCPYCHSKEVVYIILQDDDADELPELLEKLHAEGKATKRKKGDYDLPSFQCKACTYGFNLDWNATTLEDIFFTQSKDTNTSVAYPAQNHSAEDFMYMQYQQSYQPNYQSLLQNQMNSYVMGGWNNFMQSAGFTYPAYNPFQSMPAFNYMMPQYGQMPAVSTGWLPQSSNNSYSYTSTKWQVGNAALNQRNLSESKVDATESTEVKSEKTMSKVKTNDIVAPAPGESSDVDKKSVDDTELYTMDLDENVSADGSTMDLDENVSADGSENRSESNSLILTESKMCGDDTNTDASVRNDDTNTHSSVSNDDTNTHASVSNDDTNTHASVSNDDTNTHSSVSNDDTNTHASVSNDDTNTHSSVSNDDTNTHASVSNDDTNTYASVSNDDTNTHASDNHSKDEKNGGVADTDLYAIDMDLDLDDETTIEAPKISKSDQLDIESGNSQSLSPQSMESREEASVLPLEESDGESLKVTDNKLSADFTEAKGDHTNQSPTFTPDANIEVSKSTRNKNDLTKKCALTCDIKPMGARVSKRIRKQKPTSEGFSEHSTINESLANIESESVNIVTDTDARILNDDAPLSEDLDNALTDAPILTASEPNEIESADETDDTCLEEKTETPQKKKTKRKTASKSTQLKSKRRQLLLRRSKKK